MKTCFETNFNWRAPLDTHDGYFARLSSKIILDKVRSSGCCIPSNETEAIILNIYTACFSSIRKTWVLPTGDWGWEIEFFYIIGYCGLDRVFGSPIAGLKLIFSSLLTFNYQMGKKSKLKLRNCEMRGLLWQSFAITDKIIFCVLFYKILDIVIFTKFLDICL